MAEAAATEQTMRDDQLTLAWPRISADVRRRVLASVAVAGAYYVGAQLGSILRFPGLPTSVLWPPNTILLVALLLAPLQVGWWGTILLAAFVAHLLALTQAGVPPTTLVFLFGSNAALAVLGAAGVRWALRSPPRLDDRHSVAAFLVWAAAIAPVVTSFADAAVVTLTHWGALTSDDYWTVWWARTSSNALTVLALGPALLLGATRGVTWLRGAPRRRRIEAGLLVLALLAVGLPLLGIPPGAAADSPPAVALLYAPLPVLLWAATRFGPGGASTALLTVALLTVGGAARGVGPFAGHSPSQGLLALQAFLVLLGAPLLLLAATGEEQRAAATALRRRHDEIDDLANRLLTTRDDERRRLASELHDSVTQAVYGLILLSEAGRRTAEAGDPAGTARIHALVGETATKALKDLRLLMYDLRPNMLGDQGLVGAIENRLRTVERRAGVEARLTIEGGAAVQRLSPAAEEALFGIAQEALNNALKHAAAAAVTVTLRFLPDAGQNGSLQSRSPQNGSLQNTYIEIVIADDGRGFDLATVGSGLGLVGMHERAQRAGGSLTIESAPGMGTRVTARLPVARSVMPETRVPPAGAARVSRVA
jgi:signal transduction histidine kinase